MDDVFAKGKKNNTVIKLFKYYRSKTYLSGLFKSLLNTFLSLLFLPINMFLPKKRWYLTDYLVFQTRNHNWAVFVNPVVQDAAIAYFNARCTAAGYIWNPTFVQIIDQSNVSKSMSFILGSVDITSFDIFDFFLTFGNIENVYLIHGF